MEIQKAILFQAIKKLKKEQVIQLLESSFINMERKEQRSVFGKLYNEITKKDRTPESLLKDIEDFYQKSMNGHYYSSFMMNSKNFSNVPEETEEWFDELSDKLDFTSKLVAEEQYVTALKCFKILYELIERMGNGENIVFADELGDWMIHAKTDYVQNHIIALSHTLETTEEYVEILIPMIKMDSYFSLYNKVYQKVKKHATKEQLSAINKEVKSLSIRIE